jgi:hypothetical protein
MTDKIKAKKEIRIIADKGTILTKSEIEQIMYSFEARGWDVEFRRDEQWVFAITK